VSVAIGSKLIQLGEPVLHIGRWNTLADKDAHEGVPQVVKPHGRYTVHFEYLPEMLYDPGNRAAIQGREAASPAACVGCSQYVLPGNTFKVFVLL
jgi:hypothetical protein